MLGGIGHVEIFEYGPEYCQRGCEVVNSSGAHVDLIGDGVQRLLRVHRQIRPFRQVLAQQAVGILT